MQKAVTFAMVLSFLVVMLGVYTRLSDAGLGCPDWPGCYGHLVLPSALENAQGVYPEQLIESTKAWTEMIHRYAAGMLAGLIFCIGISGIIRKNWKIPVLLLLLVVFQAALGMWTVTLKLMPLIVLCHLLGGMLIFSLLCLLQLKFSMDKQRDQDFVAHRQNPRIKWGFWVKLGLLILLVQIILGGWVSSNYAGIACIGFPTCNGQWFPDMNFSQGFDFKHLLKQMTANHQGGLLEPEARIAIQYMHRLFAIITAAYLIISSLLLFFTTPYKQIQRLVLLIAFLVILQLALGIMNVLYLLPLPVAIAHNGIATLLLASELCLVFLVSRKGAMHVNHP